MALPQIQVLRTGAEFAAVAGEWLTHLVCGLNCRYNGTGIEAHALGKLLVGGTSKGRLTVNGQELNKESGIFCPSIVELDITTEALEATYISS